MLKSMQKRDWIWFGICAFLMTGSIVGSKVYYEFQYDKVYQSRARYINQSEYTIMELYNIAKQYEAIIKKCKCAQI